MFHIKLEEIRRFRMWCHWYEDKDLFPSISASLELYMLLRETLLEMIDKRGPNAKNNIKGFDG